MVSGENKKSTESIIEPFLTMARFKLGVLEHRFKSNTTEPRLHIFHNMYIFSWY